MDGFAKRMMLPSAQLIRHITVSSMPRSAARLVCQRNFNSTYSTGLDTEDTHGGLCGRLWNRPCGLATPRGETHGATRQWLPLWPNHSWSRKGWGDKLPPIQMKWHTDTLRASEYIISYAENEYHCRGQASENSSAGERRHVPSRPALDFAKL